MSMRRSRLQVKPNIGARGAKPGVRASKPDDKTVSNATSPKKSPARSKEPTKPPEKLTQELLITEDKSTKANLPSVEPRKIVLECHKKLRSHSASENSEPVHVDDACNDAVSDQRADHSTDTRTEEQLTKIRDKPNPSTTPENHESPGETVEQKPPASANKPQPRLRSRFNRAKPNLSEAGKSRTRKSTVNAQEKKPADVLPAAPPEVSVKALPSNDSATLAGLVPQDVSSQPPHCVYDVVDDGALTTAAEVVVAADINQPAEEDVFIPSARPASPPARVPSPTPSSVAESEVSLAAESVDMPSPTQPVRKPRKRPSRMLSPADQPPDKYKMLMKDLIYWNPTNNPMKVKEKRPKSSEGSVVSEPVSEKVLDEAPPSGAPEMGEENSLPVPQVKIGPDGSIVLNEESLVIDRKSDQSELSDVGVLEETDSLITYASFRPRHLSKTWTDRETQRFYYALSVVGTDFSMMSKLFKHRDRYDLKKKFKREEKCNRARIDKALHERKKFDMSVFENISDERGDGDPKKKSRKRVRSRGDSKGRGQGKTKGTDKRGGDESEVDNAPSKRKKYNKKRRKRSQFYCEDSEEEEEPELSDKAVPEETGPEEVETGAESVPTGVLELEDDDEGEELPRIIARRDSAHSSDEEELRVLDSMRQTTRSGRVPKKRSIFTVNDISPTRKPGVRSPEPSTRSQGTSPVKRPLAKQTATRIKPVQESMEIHNVQNIPSVDGSQLVLVTQKGGEDCGEQGTVIHVYMLSPPSMLSSEWPGSPRPSPHVYSVSPRGVPNGNPSPFPVTAVRTSIDNPTMEHKPESNTLEPPVEVCKLE